MAPVVFPPFTLSGLAGENERTDETLKIWSDALANVPVVEILPPNLEKDTWTKILDEFRSIVGPDSVFTGELHKLHYGDPFALFDNDTDIRGSAAALRPTTVEQIQAILKLANQHKIPLWTIGRGKNLGYGGPAARVKGSVIIDLQNMDKVLEVNDKYAYYTVEPGVSFFKLFETIKEQKKNIWCSVPALGWGSIVGNALDRGWGYTPNGDHSNQICGLEAVLADGSIIRTGMGSLDNSVCWPLFRGGYGPTYDSMFNQSNFGIVTKMTLWSSPAPESFMSCHVAVPEEKDLEVFIDTFRGLLLDNTIQNHPVIGNVPRELGKRGPRKKWWPKAEGMIPDERMRELQKELNLHGWWDANFGLYGPKEIIEVNYKRCVDAFAKIPGSKIRGNPYYPKEGQKYLEADAVPYDDTWMQTGVPSMAPICSIQYRGNDGGHLSFSPVLPSDGKAVLDFYYSLKESCIEYGFEFVAGLHLYARHLNLINMIYFDRTNPEEKDRANRFFVDLVHRARAAGYSEYRAHVEHMDLVADQYDFNGHSLMRLNEKIKDTLDPNGILSPGKQGIWPREYREKGIKNPYTKKAWDAANAAKL